MVGIEPDFLTVPELAVRWGQSARQIIEHGLALRLAIVFQFDGLVFDASDVWHRYLGGHRERQELAHLQEMIKSSEDHIRRNAAGLTGEFDLLSRDDVIALRASIREWQGEASTLTRKLETRDQGRRRCVFRGHMRVPPAVLWELRAESATKMPWFAFHPESDVWVAKHDGQPVWDGRLMALEPGLVGEWKDTLCVDDLFVVYREVIALEASQMSLAASDMQTDGRDWLAKEIADALSALPAGVKPTPLAVLGQLRERVGKGVITDITADNAVIWTDGSGDPQKLTIQALGARLRRRSKHKGDARTTQKRR